MPLNIKNPEVERLIDELVALTGETKTEAVRRAVEERTLRVAVQAARPRRARLLSFLRDEVWPALPDEVRGKGVSQDVQDELLGYTPESR
jgi:antitoxin VapB